MTHTHTFSLHTLLIVPLTVSTYSSPRCRGQEEGKDALFRKRKVLQLVSHWSRLYKDFLKEEEHVRSFMKVQLCSPSSSLYKICPHSVSSSSESDPLVSLRNRSCLINLHLSPCFCLSISLAVLHCKVGLSFIRFSGT